MYLTSSEKQREKESVVMEEGQRERARERERERERQAGGALTRCGGEGGRPGATGVDGR